MLYSYNICNHYELEKKVINIHLLKQTASCTAWNLHLIHYNMWTYTIITSIGHKKTLADRKICATKAFSLNRQ